MAQAATFILLLALLAPGAFATVLDVDHHDSRKLLQKCRLTITGCKALNKACTGCAACNDGYFLDTATLRCTSCGTPPSNCAVTKCTSASNVWCETCATGFAKNALGACEVPCETRISGCATQGCYDTTCTQCSSGYWLNTAKDTCAQCTSTMDGCRRLTCLGGDGANPVCEECRSGFVLFANECFPCEEGSTSCTLPEGYNPESFDPTAEGGKVLTSTACKDGYFLASADGDCDKCATIDGCTKVLCPYGADEPYCAQGSCKNGWESDPNKPGYCRTKRISHCDFQETTEFVCRDCSTGYYVEDQDSLTATYSDPVGCALCTAELSCVDCSDVDTCTACEVGSYLMKLDGTTSCAACDAASLSAQCVAAECDDTDGSTAGGDNVRCTRCADGWELDEAGDCVIAHCTTYADPFTDGCASDGCESGYYSSGTGPTLCLTCTNDFFGCSAVTCTSSTDQTCSSCSNGWETSAADAAYPCVVDNCRADEMDLNADGDYVCTYCEDGFVGDDCHVLKCPTGSTACSAGDGHAITSTACDNDGGYWLNQGTCVRCTNTIPSCSKFSCSDNVGAVCSECKTGFFEASGGASCSECDSKCLSCDGSATDCDACLNGFWHDDTANTCNTCVNDITGCDAATCAEGTGDKTCTRCSQGWESDGNGGCQTVRVANCAAQAYTEVVCPTCNDGYYGGLCIACPTGCATCDMVFGLCTACSEGWNPVGDLALGTQCINCDQGTKIENCENQNCNTLTASYTCAQCTTGFFSADGGVTCKPCSEGCSSCSYDGFSEVCAANSCIAGYFAIESDGCSRCASIDNCEAVTCTTLGDSTCTICSSGFHDNGANTPACKSCTTDVDNCESVTCNAAGDGSDAVCASCLAGFALDGNQECLPCSDVANCKHCSYGTALTCDLCQPGYIATAEGTCEEKCKNTFDNCARAQCNEDGTGAQCVSCSDGFFLNGGTCSSCALGTDGVAGCDRCSLNTDTVVCSHCAPDFEMYDVSEGVVGCRPKTPPCNNGFYKDAENICVSCADTDLGGMANCNECSYAASTFTCVGCQGGYELNEAGTACELVPVEPEPVLEVTEPASGEEPTNNEYGSTEPGSTGESTEGSTEGETSA